MVLSEGVKQRLSVVIELGKTVFHYGFIPTVVYLGTQILFNNYLVNKFCSFLGFQKGADPGMPEITLSR